MLCVPMSRMSTASQSSDTNALVQCGEPVTSVPQTASANRSCIGMLPTPAKTCESSLCSAFRQLMQSTRLVLLAVLVTLLPWTQTRSIAGSSLTAHTAEQVTPARPAGLSVVTTDTVVASLESAPRNSAAVTQLAVTAGALVCDTCSGIAAFPTKCAWPDFA